MSNVSITLYNNDESRGLIAAILKDNPASTTMRMPGVVKIDCPNKITILRETVENELGRPWDVQQLHMSLVSLSGMVDEDDDYFTIAWNH